MSVVSIDGAFVINQEELSEFERLRLKAQEKQRAKLTAIRQAESDMVAKSIQRKSNTINRRINDFDWQLERAFQIKVPPNYAEVENLVEKEGYESYL